MINTILYNRKNRICCHSVGIANCLEIIDTETEPNTYLYKVIYEGKNPTKIKNVILATDIKLA